MLELKNSGYKKLKYFLSLKNRARYKLIKRYKNPVSYYNKKIINEILCNEKTHYVEQFKEYLIYEDYNEFLKRFYKSYEIRAKLKKILKFYQKYSKIYANYTSLPESKYMYKNIRRKQKMIEQIHNKGNNNSENEEEDKSNDLSNIIFSSQVINSIYGKTISTVNKSENNENTEQSINEFLGKINKIENKIYNGIKIIYKDNKILKDELFLNKNLKKEFIINKTKAALKGDKNNYYKIKNNELNKKNIDIRFTYSKKILANQNDIKKNNQNNSNSKNNKPNFSNLILINNYASRSKINRTILNNNNSKFNLKNNDTINNDNNTFNGYRYSIKTNINFPKHKIISSLLKQNLINNSKIVNNYKENINLTNINNYITNINNNIYNRKKNKLNLREKLLKLDKKILSINTSSSKKIVNKNKLSLSNNKINIIKNKNHLIINDKDYEKHKIEILNKGNQVLLSNKTNKRQKISYSLRSNNYNSFTNNLTFLTNKILENKKLKSFKNKLNKQKNNDKQKESEKQFLFNDNNINRIHTKPESHRNYYQSKILSINNSNPKIKITNNSNNSNKNYKIKEGLKYKSKNCSKIINSTPCSPKISSYNYDFKTQLSSNNNNKSNKNKLDKNMKKSVRKIKVTNNFNINNIHDNNTQINIFAGNNLYRSLNYNNNSIFNGSNIISGNISSRSPINREGGNIINKNNIIWKRDMKSNNATIKYNLDLRKIIPRQNKENEKSIVNTMKFNNRSLFEKLGKYFKIKNGKKNIIYNRNKNIKSKNNNKNSNKKNKNIYNDYSILINKIVNKNCNSCKFLKNKTNNNSPVKSKYTPYISKNHIKIPKKNLLTQDNEKCNLINKDSSRQNINYSNIFNLNDLKNIGVDEGTKLMIYSERNKISNNFFKY